MTETIDGPGLPRFPQDRTCPYQPPKAYEQLQNESGVCPVQLYDGTPAWVVTGFALARELLSNGSLSADRKNPGYPIVSARMEGVRHQPPSFVGMDPPGHTRHRRMMLAEFSVARLEAMRPLIEGIVEEYVGRMRVKGGPVDLVQEFSLPVPSKVICELLGVPYEDHDFFQVTSQQLVQAESPQQAVGAVQELSGYLAELIGGYTQAEGPGLLGRLARERVATGELEFGELIMNAIMLLIAGHETTASMISLSVVTLLDHPEQLDKMLSGPEFVPGAVEELLRYLSIADIAGARVAARDIEVDGQHIPAGSGVIVTNSLANRDPQAFEEPDRLDVERGDLGHLAFGYGVHQCLGQNLARLELQIALPALFRALPGLRLTVPVEDLRLRDGGTVQGTNQLEITWDHDGAAA